MENLIKQILEIDRKAQQETEQAEARRAAMEQSVQARKLELHNQYIKHAEEHIDTLRQKQEDMVQKKVTDSNRAVEEQCRKLEEIYQKNHTQWVDELFQQVIGG